MSGTVQAARPQLVEPLANHRFDASALAEWLGRVTGDPVRELEILQFQGGMSNPTFLVTLPGDRRYVLRKKPPGKLLPKAHAIDREYRIMEALGPSAVPVPRMISYCADSSVIGAEFYLMSHVEGRLIPDAAMSAVAPPERRALSLSLIDTLAALHNVDWRAAGLEGYGRPEGYLSRQTARWAGQYEASKQALPADFDYSEMDWLRDWLMAHADVAEEAAISHGDFRIGNMIVAEEAPEIVAVLDWELSTIGHPFSDLAYLCLPYRLPPDVPGACVEAGAGLPGEAELLARYGERTGRERIADWPIFLAFNAFRFAAIIQGVAARAAQGNASSASADPERDGWRARRIAECGAGIARKMEQEGG